MVGLSGDNTAPQRTRSNGAHALSGVNGWTVATLILVALFVSPIIAVFVKATGDSGDLWHHLFTTVLPRYAANTLILMFGVGLLSVLFGVTTAWLVVRYEFPGRRMFEWMLLLPAAVPAYLVAYTLTDFLEYAGPVQKMLRELAGWQSARDYWFPEIRSMEGAILVMGAVLYPYVYMMARTAFILTPASLFEVSMVSGRGLFRSVGLPLARPAIIAGLALVLMETISDFGTVEYFAIETLTLGIFNVWLGMNSLTAAAQIAVFSFLFILLLLGVEILARSHRRYVDTGKRARFLPRHRLTGLKAMACFAASAFPVLAGFVLPVCVLLGFVIEGHSVEFSDAIVTAATNSISLAFGTALFVMATAAFMVFVSHYQASEPLQKMTAVASIGYAFPGTILAIGVVTAAGAVDAASTNIMSSLFGVQFDGWLTGGIGLVLVACAVRFQAIGYGAMTTGLERLPPNIVHASRTLGHGFGGSLRDIVLPLMWKSFIAGGLLVFVDVMKELPMTLLLRPFNFETLATYVYQFAKDELLEEAALPALIIVLVGIVPVVIMNSALRRLSR